MKFSLVLTGGLLLTVLQQVCCQQQTPETCGAIRTLISGRNVESAGETCTINEECTSFFCTGVVDPDNNPPAVADSTYTFLPCEDPIAIHILSTVSSLPGMVIDAQLNDSAVIVLNPEFLGTVELTFEQTEDGVRFGYVLNEVDLPPGLELFPETEIPLQCEPFAGASVCEGNIVMLLILACVLCHLL